MEGLLPVLALDPPSALSTGRRLLSLHVNLPDNASDRLAPPSSGQSEDRRDQKGCPLPVTGVCHHPGGTKMESLGCSMGNVAPCRDPGNGLIGFLPTPATQKIREEQTQKGPRAVFRNLLEGGVSLY